MVLSDVSSVGNASLRSKTVYPNYTGFSQQEIDKGYEDGGFINEDSSHQNPYSHTERLIQERSRCQENSVHPKLDWFWYTYHIWYRQSRELQLQVVQHLYSTSLVVLKRDTLLRLQKEQFYSISLVLQTRVSPKTLLDLEIFSLKGYWNINILKSYRSSRVLLVFIILWLLVSSASSFDPPEGTYLHIFGGGYTDLKVGFASQSQKATLRLSGELTHPDIDFTPHYGIDRNIGIETGLTIFLGGGGGEVRRSWHCYHKVHSKVPCTPILTLMVVQYPEQTHLYNSRCYLHSWYWYRWKRCYRRSDWNWRSKVSNLVRKKDSFQLPSLVWISHVRLPDNWGRSKTNQSLWLLWRRQRSRHIWSNHHSSGRWYLHNREVSSGFTKQMDLEHTLTKVLQRRVNNILRSWFWFSIRNRWYIRNCYIRRTCCWNLHIQWNGRRMPSLHRLQKILQHLHYLEQDFAKSTTSKDLELLHSEETSIVTGVIYLTEGSGTLFGLGGAAESTVEPSAARAILTEISGVAETRYFQVFQDFVPSGTFTLSGELTHPDIDLHTSVHWYWNCQPYLVLLERGQILSERLDLVLQHFSGAAIVRITADDLEGTVLFDTKGASALTALNQVYGYYGDDRDPGTSGITTISGVGITKPIQNYGYYGDDKDPGTSGTFTFSNTPLVHPFVDYTPSIGIGVAVLYQTSGTSTNPSPSPTTRLKEDSKDLQVLKNPSVVQLTLVLVKLIPLELLKQNIAVSRKVEPMLLLSNSINKWRSITI